MAATGPGPDARTFPTTQAEARPSTDVCFPQGGCTSASLQANAANRQERIGENGLARRNYGTRKSPEFDSGIRHNQVVARTPTRLSDISLPNRAIDEIRSVTVGDYIDNHAIDVGRPWWTETLRDYGFDDTLSGETIRRADIFATADAAAGAPDAALTLLWNALAWGSGSGRRNNKARIAAVAANREAATGLLQEAAQRSRDKPLDAYDLLYPGNKTAISDLGPAFFTKYLYFAGAGSPQHPCSILDENVAYALNRTCGWTTLPLKNWYATTYERYAQLVARWVDEHKFGRHDLIERWLFEEGKRLKRSGDTSVS
jgi:hypothetical protein